MKLWTALIVIPALNIATSQAAFAGAGKCVDLFAVASSGPKKMKPLFDPKTGLVELQLSADFEKIYKAALGGNWHGEERTDAKYFSAGTLVDLKHPEQKWSMDVRARGMSSLTEGEASFPKLKVEIQKDDNLDGSLFDGSRNFRINTHVSTNPHSTLTPMGRWNGQESPWREGLAYLLAQKLDLLTPAFKDAEIQYIDTATKKTFKRHALLLETDKKLVERIGGTLVDEAKVTDGKVAHVNPQEAAKFFVFHKLIGNDDVGLRVHEPDNMATENYRPLFNTFVVDTPSKKGVPVVYDLDLSTFVAGHTSVAASLYTNEAFQLTEPNAAIFSTKFSQLRQKFSDKELQEAIAFFKSKKEELYEATRTATVDELGRKQATDHLDVFFANVDTVMTYQLLNTEGLLFYSDAHKTKNKLPLNKITEEPGALRPGTPIRVLGKVGTMLKVVILNINYDLEAGASPIGYIDATAKIGNTLDSQFVGRVDDRDMF